MFPKIQGEENNEDKRIKNKAGVRLYQKMQSKKKQGLYIARPALTLLIPVKEL